MCKLAPVFLFSLIALTTKIQATGLFFNDQDELLQNFRSISMDGLSARGNDMMDRRNLQNLYKLLKEEARSFSNDQSKFQQEMLDAHNEYRARHCAPPLRLDSALNEGAQKYAQYLVDTNTWEHSHERGVGENLYQASSSEPFDSVDGAEVTKSWYDEVEYYDYNNPVYSDDTGHFTQLIWKETKLLGTGFALTKDRRKAYAVARYSPQGNVRDNFEDNVLPGDC